jgi:uncharacterized protein YdeI (BOF family)
MKKRINILIISLLTLSLLIGCSKEVKNQTDEETNQKEQAPIRGFRGTQWGMTVDEVKNVEKFKVVKDDSTALIFSGMVYGHKADVFYSFDESGTLYSGTVKFEVSEKKLADAVSLYKTIKIELTKQLGVPSVDSVLVYDNNIISDTKDETAGLLSGNKVYTTDWNDNPGSQIGIILSKPKESPLNLGIVYERK